MNFDNIEDMAEEEINKLYDDNLIAGTGTKWEVVCDDGTVGYFNAISDDSSVSVGYYNYQCGTNSLYAPFNVCGANKCGYIRVIAHFDDTKPLTIWQVNCDNGKNGYFVAISDDSASPVGYYGYQCGTNSLYAPFNVCGSGRCGYIKLITH